jgi:hypothetical protein
MQTFKIQKYHFARCEKRGSGWWQTVQVAEFDHWVFLSQDPWTDWVDSSDSPNEWKEVYSKYGYVRADGLSLMLPEQTMNVQVEYRGPLRPEQCA